MIIRICVPRPLLSQCPPITRKFIRVASVAGSVLYRIDVRLPPMLGAMFAGTITPSQFAGILALLRGTGETDVSGEGKVYPWIPGRYTGTSQRRRLILQLEDDVRASWYSLCWMMLLTGNV